MSEWRPIETAPKDGTMILVYVEGFGLGALTMYWMNDSWREPANGMALRRAPSHWMPLPEPPK